jgi:hypothetical protein
MEAVSRIHINLTDAESNVLGSQHLQKASSHCWKHRDMCLPTENVKKAIDSHNELRLRISDQNYVRQLTNVSKPKERQSWEGVSPVCVCVSNH